MFWGLVMAPNKRYTQTVDKTFHLSMASLDVTQAENDTIQVMVCFEGTTYLLCNLNKATSQVPLDLNFQEGSKITFICNGKKSTVHLTGYLMDMEDEMSDFDEEMDDEDVEDEEEEENEIVSGKQEKRKLPQEKSQAKRSKVDTLLEAINANEDDEDDSDDEDFDDTLATLDEEDDDSEDDNSEDEDEEESDEDEEEQTVVSPKPVGKQQKQQEQKKKAQQVEKNKKQDKQKMTNGTSQSPQEMKKKQKHEQQKEVPEQKKKGQQNAQEQKKKGEQQSQGVKKTIEGGVQVEDLKVGGGAPAKPGKMISVYYVGKLKSGKKFDATQQGEGFKFRLGKGEVIKGWDIGISGMKVGGKRRITIPPHLAYGNKGSPPQIPGNSILTFEVELKNVH